MAEAKLTTVIALADRMSKPLKGINKRLSETQRPFKTLNNQVKQLDRLSGFKSLRSGVAGLTGSLAKLSTVGIGTAVAGFAALNKMAQGGDEIIKTATNYDFATDKLQEYRFIAERSGVSQASVNKSMQAFTKRLAEARNGSGELYGLLSKVNPAFLQQLLAVNDNAEAYDLLLTNMSKLPTQQQQILLGDKAFSEAGRELVKITAQGADEIENLRQQAYKYGAVLDRSVLENSAAFSDQMTNIGSLAKGVGFSIGAVLLPEMVSLMEQLSNWYVANKKVIDQNLGDFAIKLSEGIQDLARWTVDFVPKASRFIDSIGGMKTLAIGLGAVIAGPLISSIVTLSTVLLATPIGLVITGVGLLAAGALTLKNNWEPISKWFKGMWDAIGLKVDQLWQKIQPVINGVTGLYDNVTGFFGDDDKKQSINGRSVNAGILQQAQKTQVGGEISVKISADGKPRVESIKSNYPDFDIVADVGYGMVGM
ncbi:hypothetical protein [Methylophaga sp.]|uniref:hypothetical protein n=1 Tax=Methylophaga sp. TaxID=2024840 RepID=UPI003A90486C